MGYCPDTSLGTLRYDDSRSSSLRCRRSDLDSDEFTVLSVDSDRSDESALLSVQSGDAWLRLVRSVDDISSELNVFFSFHGLVFLALVVVGLQAEQSLLG